MTEPDVTKEYREDLGERDADGLYDYAYRYWVYWFDFDGRRYRARIYTDDETDASVMNIGSGRADHGAGARDDFVRDSGARASRDRGDSQAATGLPSSKSGDRGTPT